MTINKKLLVASVAGVASASFLTASTMAATSATTSYPPIVQKIADKFHLNPADVQSVFQQQRQDKKNNRMQHIKDSLDQAVTDGKITRDQENKLLNELKTLQQQRHDDKTNDRRADRQKIHDELQQWAKDNGINNLDQILPSPPIQPQMSTQ
ncbi:MAG TPA: hypothetical protein VFB03_02065 [Candidatus Saccharimonadales bacterium]|nr:hypothetical protein [Candidatus Saccharimonadales bacterium]